MKSRILLLLVLLTGFSHSQEMVSIPLESITPFSTAKVKTPELTAAWQLAKLPKGGQILSQALIRNESFQDGIKTTFEYEGVHYSVTLYRAMLLQSQTRLRIAYFPIGRPEEKRIIEDFGTSGEVTHAEVYKVGETELNRNEDGSYAATHLIGRNDFHTVKDAHEIADWKTYWQQQYHNCISAMRSVVALAKFDHEPYAFRTFDSQDRPSTVIEKDEAGLTLTEFWYDNQGSLVEKRKRVLSRTKGGDQ